MRKPEHEARYMAGLVAAKMAIAEIEADTLSGTLAPDVFKTVQRRLNDLIAESLTAIERGGESH